MQASLQIHAHSLQVPRGRGVLGGYYAPSQCCLVLVSGLAFPPPSPLGKGGARSGAPSLQGIPFLPPAALPPGPHAGGVEVRGRVRGAGGTFHVGLGWDGRKTAWPAPVPGHVRRGHYGAYYLQAGNFLKVWFCSKPSISDSQS